MSSNSSIKYKTLTIRSTKDTTNFNISINNVNYGVFKRHNSLNSNTLDSKMNLSFHYLTKRTDMVIRMIKDEEITIKFNKFKGRFELLDKDDLIINQKTYLTKFSKVFYPLLGGFILLLVILALIIIL